MIYTILAITNPVITGMTGKKPEQAPELFAKLVAGLVGMLLTAATLWTFVQLLIGGLNWISSGGDKGKLETARNRITNALIGLFICFAAWSIFLIVLNFFGISEGGEFQLKLPSLF